MRQLKEQLCHIVIASCCLFGPFCIIFPIVSWACRYEAHLQLCFCFHETSLVFWDRHPHPGYPNKSKQFTTCVQVAIVPPNPHLEAFFSAFYSSPLAFLLCLPVLPCMLSALQSDLLAKSFASTLLTSSVSSTPFSSTRPSAQCMCPL